MTFTNEQNEEGKWCTVDHDRDIVLTETYWGAPAPFAKFTLSLKDKDVFFEAEYRTQSLGPSKGKIVRWLVYRINGILKRRMKKR